MGTAKKKAKKETEEEDTQTSVTMKRTKAALKRSPKGLTIARAYLQRHVSLFC